MKKLKIIMNRLAENIPALSLGNEMIVEGDEYNYIGRVVSADSNHEKEIRRRMSTGGVRSGGTLPLILKRRWATNAYTPSDDLWGRKVGDVY